MTPRGILAFVFFVLSWSVGGIGLVALAAVHVAMQNNSMPQPLAISRLQVAILLLILGGLLAIRSHQVHNLEEKP